MNKKLATLKLNAAEELTAVENAMTVIANFFANVNVLDAGVKRQAAQMGEKSEAFCRNTLMALTQNPGLVPPDLDVNAALADLKTRDLLGPFLLRLEQIYKRLVDADFALGADVMAVALQGYRQLKSMGRAAGLETLQREVGGRFARKSRVQAKPAPVASAGG